MPNPYPMLVESDQETQEAADHVRINATRRLRRAYRTVAATAEGRQVIADLLNFCLYNDEIFVLGDPHATAYQAGKRRVALRFMQMARLTQDEIDDLAKRKGEF